MLGERLREVRTRGGFSLNEVSAMSGIARSTLYKVESAGMSLTYDNLIRLSDGLGIDIAELFGNGEDKAKLSTGAVGRRAVGGHADGFQIATPIYDYSYLCNELRQKQMVPMLGVIKVHSLDAFGPMISHPGEEFSYVLKGTLVVHTQYYEPLTLQEGEYIYLDSMMPHAYVAGGDSDALVLCVCSSPDTDLAEQLTSLMSEVAVKA